MAILSIEDPIREEVPEAVKSCQRAGITVRMVTGLSAITPYLILLCNKPLGDNLLTAKKIAKDCGILTEGGEALDGITFAKMTDDELDRKLPRLQVLARSLPADKLRLVQRLMYHREVVAGMRLFFSST